MGKDTCRGLTESNQTAKQTAADFYKKFKAGIVGDPDFQKIKHAYPYFGFVRCVVEDSTFLMFSANDDVVAWHYFWLGNDSYEADVISLWLEHAKTARTILDIGAYTGLMSMIAALNNETAEIHAFEPMPRTFERMWINLKINKLASRVQPHNVAASDSSGPEEIYLYREPNFLGTGNSIHLKTHVEAKGKVRIEKNTVDSYGLKDVDLVKIDTEGHELQVLRGMQNILQNDKPTLVVEVWRHEQEELLDFLDQFGYKRVQLQGMNWLFHQ